MYCPQLIRLSYRMCLNRNSVTEASPKGAECDLLPLFKAGICAFSADRDPRLLTDACLERGMCIPLAKQSPIFINYSLCLLASESLSHLFWVGRPPVFTTQTVSFTCFCYCHLPSKHSMSAKSTLHLRQSLFSKSFSIASVFLMTATTNI